MIPIIEYGSIAVVIPKISAVGSMKEARTGFSVDIIMTGVLEPLTVIFATEEEAIEARNDLIAAIAQYYYTVEFGVDEDFFSDLVDFEEDDDNFDEIDEEDIPKEKH